MFKTVIFDLGGVYFTDGTKNAIELISQKYNISEQKIKDVLKGELGTKYRIGTISSDEFWKQAKEYWNINTSSEDLSNIWLQGYTPIIGTDLIIDKLKSSGYEILFLSDNVQERIDYIQKKYPFLNKFKDGVFSHIVHTRKPDPEIYKIILKKSTHPAAECIYIDDKIELLKPAEELGMTGIVFENPSQLEKKLKELGLNF